ncbi:multidrug efflux RND transporter permease subunit [Novosphingobium resinovorum]|uniref:Efflux pump membrane transporter n=1 Tax=Novosphingobium resinovorum TaxID=158500 RepID=A0A031K0Z5_9SPHN|nr:MULTISPECIES: multidrug efflux RND transporter permease subunit [Sphingomonadaceae]EJU10230.1 hydrophobe/amphiphile efflux-1 (HAE1) family protein [Sphingomonas sp. LH128]EZP82713.1 Hydrophobe/amphiphile efflux-1 (HAE1) family protein [Novosphingobium resinovorum]MBF7014641.1 multidrug efflux RND transporter permease subunit [Novosphingobium sp. HR1a]WJM24878.1 multidrug efflux RND transporter permease subunit [Novosphingobium resinovorum]
MRLSRFFIDRPIFAGVVAVIITIVGAIAFIGLPVSQYPDIVPPTVTVNAQYPGASAETVADTVAAPIEQEINGVDNMLYMDSQSTGDGKVTITVTFKIGTDLDAAQVLVQNRVAIAEPRLPDAVRSMGVVTKKASPDFLMVVNLQSPDGTYDRDYISNYALTQVKDRLARLDGVGDVQTFGARDYGMRIWIDPGRAAQLNLTAGEIVAALRAQNVQISAGAIGAPPFDKGNAYQIGVEAQGRLTEPQQFADIIVRTDADGHQVRVRDVARVELGAQDYTTNTYLSGNPTVVMAVMQRPGSNALETAKLVRSEMDAMQAKFPKGLEYSVIYNPTEFIGQSIDAVYHTLFEAVILVVLVILVFLQNWRAAIIPILAIPVSLVGTAIMLMAVGYSLNNLSLFGLVLAIGIVVDDAIVVVENVERYIEEGLTPLEAARRSMDEVSGALVAIVLVLCAVFVPTLFITGISGQFYKQFAVTISTATVISLVLSLTLSPAMAALLLKHKERVGPAAPRWRRALQSGADKFNHGFDRMSASYARLTLRLVKAPTRMMATYAALIAGTVGLFWATPTGFIPQQDQGYFLAAAFLPSGSSLERTDEVTKDIAKRLLPIKGIRGAVMFAGFHGPSRTASPDSAAIYFPFKSFEERKELGVTGAEIMAQAQEALKGYDKAMVLVIPPPTINGIVPPGGYRMIVEDNEGRGYTELAKAAGGVIGKANQQKDLSQVYTLFNQDTPRVFTDIDRRKADMLGIPPERVFETLQVYLGSAYVNDFNLLGRTFRVTAQADQGSRGSIADLANLKTRSNSGAMVPIGSVATFQDKTGPYRVVRYNLHPAVEVDGSVAPGFSTGQALSTMEKVANETLPSGYSFEWTGIAYQQVTAGNTAAIVFGMAVVFVFLVLAAQYESLTLPLAIVLIVPMCLFAAMAGVNLRGMDNNILTQIGLVVLIALAAKNAILVVEFAKQAEEEQGMGIVEAAVYAAQTRLRPILMTSFAFILGAVPLVIAQGAGAELRQALGTAVFFGMTGVTGFGLLFTPTFYVVCRGLAEKLRRRPRPHHADLHAVPAE